MKNDSLDDLVILGKNFNGFCDFYPFANKGLSSISRMNFNSYNQENKSKAAKSCKISPLCFLRFPLRLLAVN